MSQPRDFGFGEEQEMLKESALRFITDKQPLLALRKAIEGTEDPYFGEERTGSYDKSAWDEMVQLGWTALAVPEEAGGVGMDLVTAVAVAEEVGRGAMPTPLTETLQATFLLREAGTDAANSWLGKIAGGAAASLALHGADGFFDADVSCDGTTLNGTACFVQDLQKVDFLVVATHKSGKQCFACVDLNAEGIEIKHDRIVDLTRDQGRVTFNNVAAECVTENGEEALSRALPALYTLVAADMAGGCEWLLQTTAEYAKVRAQFDRPIGFFQAVKHPIVNMMIMADETRSLVYNAACAYDAEPEKAQLAAHLAKSSASDTAQFCANRATQLHGGIGFTWEHDVQIYHKRLIHAQQMYGDGVWHRQQAADCL
jgi:alkylation response protein AidB-like acyl-CoA dehydrogenase